MSNSISINELSAELAKNLGKYTADVGEQVKAVTDEIATMLVKDTKKDAPKRTGEYRKHIAKKTLFENNYEKKVIWHVKEPYHRVAHLLENSHKIVRNGVVIGHAAPHPHIEKNVEKAMDEFKSRIEEVLNNIGI